MNNFSKSSKKIVTTLVTLASVAVLSSSVYADGATEVNNSKQFTSNDSKVVSPVTNSVGVPSVNYYNDINDYDKFAFKKDGGITTRGTSEPSSEWDFSNGAYDVNGSSNKATLYSNYYFKNVVGRTFNFTAGSSNRITVDLVHKGIIWQTVVSSWTIDAGSSKNVTIKTSDLNGESSSGSYYFRFNSNPLGNAYSVTGTFQ
ncbi:hypothetical protein [Paenibacillus chitinolyticus]|uniref:hypothetical protein n=1 Tax=Paenibacillus chitinolyticus TaxID=79263 RepID=UPI0026E4AFCF|nr:hypothetical protein [Paenibacillus chitinolyticus]GKS10922.1 hypothetical protein YDYSY3_19220 [Paenibacillus chitinolyticus]